MTLEQFLDTFNIKPQRIPAYPKLIVIHDNIAEPARSELFHLDDYRVSSVSAGSIYLLPKREL